MAKPKSKDQPTQQIEVEGKTFKVIQPRARDLIKLAVKYSDGTPEEIADKMSEHVMLNWVIEPNITVEMYDDPKNAKVFTILAGKLLQPLKDMAKNKE